MSELLFISVFNYGGIELAKNHLESLKRNNISNYIAYVTDDESYNELLTLNYNVTKYINSDDIISKDAMDFETPGFINLTYVRYKIINNLLIQGKAVWMLDIDTVVLTDLNSYYNSLSKNFDICFQNDINMLCAGCMLIMPTIKTIKLTEFMYSNKNNGFNDQIFINNILNNNKEFIIGMFNENNFPNGLLYFNEPNPKKHLRDAQEKFKQSTLPIYFVHANYMVGIDRKIEAFKSKNLWFI
jgi:hypothetical protein